MSEFKFSCPHCQRHLKCSEADSGRQIQCPACNVLIRIPPVPGQTANYQPEQGKTWDTFVNPRKGNPGKTRKADS
jgi:DNA-directed RNA polymerase subunit RPC12/RpoP